MDIDDILKQRIDEVLGGVLPLAAFRHWVLGLVADPANDTDLLDDVVLDLIEPADSEAEILDRLRDSRVPVVYEWGSSATVHSTTVVRPAVGRPISSSESTERYELTSDRFARSGS